MRKWFAVLAVGACVCLSAMAQEKHDESEGAKASEAPKANFTKAVGTASRSPWALAAQPTPAAAPAPASTDSTAWGQRTPRWEVGGGYSYVNFQPGDPFNSYGQHGGTASFTFNPTSYLGLTGEFGGYSFQRNVNSNQVQGSMTTLLFGPRLNWRRFDHFVPFTEFLFGFTNSGVETTGSNTQSTFALATGGGVDVVLTKYLAWRFAQIDYLMTNFSGPNVGSSGRQNNLRLGSGLVLRWGYPNVAPPAVNHPPVAACSVSPASVYAGSSDAVALHVNASDPDNDPLTYSYSATGGTIEGTGADARWTPSGLAVGTYTATAKVDDGKGGTASCSADLKVEPKPHHAPTVSCATDRSPIMPGEKTGITATGNSPDGLPLTYSYSAASGQVTGDGPKATFDSTGLQPGSYPVKCMVSDGQPDGNADATTNVDVQQPPPPPQATKAGDCGYNAVGAARFDNACKRVGDDVALRLKNDPTAKLVIVGYADGKEPKAAKLAQARADGAKKYLGEKGIDATRISTRVGEASKEKGQEKANRRVDFVIVPEGGTY